MSIIERLRQKAAGNERIEMGDWLDLVAHIQQIEQSYQRLISSGLHCHVKESKGEMRAFVDKVAGSVS